MELSQDWKAFQKTFFPRRRMGSLPGPQATRPAYFVVNGSGAVLSAFSEGEDLSEWIGSSPEEVRSHFEHREMFFFQRKDVDQWLQECMTESHFFHQVEFLRAKSTECAWVPGRSKGLKKGRVTEIDRVGTGRHFLLEGLKGWWSRVFPSAYGIYVCLETERLLLVVRRGRLESFYGPDLGQIKVDRAGEPGTVVKYLSEKHGIPVQGIFLDRETWNHWSTEADPWGEVAAAVKTGKCKLVPFRWSVATLVAFRAFLGV